MRHKLTVFSILMLFSCLVVPQLCNAITISAPRTAEVGQPVAITVQGVLLTPPSAGCYIMIEFGVETGQTSAQSPECATQFATCGFTTTHTYQQPGTYRLLAYSSGACPQGSGAFSPDRVVKYITVVDLNIERIDLYFNDHTPKTTVKQYQRDLKAFADIRYNGSGQLQGQWEIDGRLFSKFSKQLHRGRQKITISTPVAPPLPTYAVGSHLVKFVVTRPAGALDLPQAIYFVTADTDQFTSAIQLTTPKDNQLIACEPTAFQWKAISKAYVYLVEFIEEEDGDPTFSAYAKKSEYTLKKDVCKSLFSTGRSYHWRVKALDQEGHIIGQSETFNLVLNK